MEEDKTHDEIPDNSALKAALKDFAMIVSLLACIAALVYLW